MNNDIEYASPAEIRAFQENLLHDALVYLQACSPYYRQLFRENGVDIARIRHLEDLADLPFTEKKDLQLRNWDFLCCP